MKVIAPFMTVLREAAYMLVLAAFVFRALVPVGFMPSLADASGMHMVICASDGEKTIIADDASNPLNQNDTHKKYGGFCGFAANTGGVVPVPSLAIVPMLAGGMPYVLTGDYAAPRAYSAFNEASRAPPSA